MSVPSSRSVPPSMSWTYGGADESGRDDVSPGGSVSTREAATATSDPLPNQLTTWGAISRSVEEFEHWRERTGNTQNSEDTSLLCYLSDQLGVEGEPLVGARVNHPVLGLLSYMSERNSRMQELLYAYLAIVVEQNLAPAKKLVAGQRLRRGLHPEYVAATRCYGDEPKP